MCGPVSGRAAHSVRRYFSTSADGDFARPNPESLAALDVRLLGDSLLATAGPLGWTWSRQVHGADAHVVTEPGPAPDGDALVTAVPGLALSIRTADCCPVLMWTDHGTIAAVHAGWRGLVAGVLESTVSAIRAAGDESPLHAQIGPLIGACCYEFGDADLEVAVERLGPEVRSTTTAGSPSLDVLAGVRSVLSHAGVLASNDDPSCTRCGAGQFSHRRGDLGRQVAAIVLLEGPA